MHRQDIYFKHYAQKIYQIKCFKKQMYSLKHSHSLLITSMNWQVHDEQDEFLVGGMNDEE